MCRNITALRGLEPPATTEEIRDAARQFVRKVAGLSTPQQLERDDVRRAVEEIAQLTQDLLVSLPARRVASVGPPGRWRQPGTAAPTLEG